MGSVVVSGAILCLCFRGNKRANWSFSLIEFMLCAKEWCIKRNKDNFLKHKLQSDLSKWNYKSFKQADSYTRTHTFVWTYNRKHYASESINDVMCHFVVSINSTKSDQLNRLINRHIKYIHVHFFEDCTPPHPHIVLLGNK